MARSASSRPSCSIIVSAMRPQQVCMPAGGMQMASMERERSGQVTLAAGNGGFDGAVRALDAAAHPRDFRKNALQRLLFDGRRQSRVRAEPVQGKSGASSGRYLQKLFQGLRQRRDL